MLNITHPITLLISVAVVTEEGAYRDVEEIACLKFQLLTLSVNGDVNTANVRESVVNLALLYHVTSHVIRWCHVRNAKG